MADVTEGTAESDDKDEHQHPSSEWETALPVRLCTGQKKPQSLFLFVLSCIILISSTILKYFCYLMNSKLEILSFWLMFKGENMTFVPFEESSGVWTRLWSTSSWNINGVSLRFTRLFGSERTGLSSNRQIGFIQFGLNFLPVSETRFPLFHRFQMFSFLFCCCGADGSLRHPPTDVTLQTESGMIRVLVLRFMSRRLRSGQKKAGNLCEGVSQPQARSMRREEELFLKRCHL